MSPHEHARLLFEHAEKQGQDAPSEEMVSDALNCAHDNAMQDAYVALKQGGFGQAASHLERLERRMWSGDKVLHNLPKP